MSNEESVQAAKVAKAQLTLRLAKENYTEPTEQEAVIQKILASIPPAVMDTRGDKSDHEMALMYADTYFEAGKESTAAQGRETKPTTVAMSGEEKMAIMDYLESNAEEIEARSARTRVISLLTDKPVLGAIIGKNAQLKPSINENAEANFAKWEKVLLDTPENKKKFQQMKATWMKGDFMDVYVNPDAKEKVIGYAIETINDEKVPVVENYDKEGTIAFLMVKVNGAIPPKGEDSVGLRLNWTASRAEADNENGAATKGTTNVLVLNRKAVTNNPDLRVCTSVPVEANGAPVMNENYNAKTEDFFVIQTDRRNSKGEIINRKVRLSGKTTVQAVERLEQYQAVFGTNKGPKGGMTKSEKAKAQEALLASFHSLRSGTSALNNGMLRKALADIKRNAAVANGASQNFV